MSKRWRSRRRRMKTWDKTYEKNNIRIWSKTKSGSKKEAGNELSK